MNLYILYIYIFILSKLIKINSKNIKLYKSQK